MSMKKTVYIGPYFQSKGPLEPSIEHQYHAQVGDRMWSPEILSGGKTDDIWLPNIIYGGELKEAMNVLEDGGYSELPDGNWNKGTFARFYHADLLWFQSKYSGVSLRYGIVVYWS